MKENNWDILAKEIFDTEKINNLHPSAIDNILIAHPAIHSIIESYFKKEKTLKVLDFGCGSGSFVNELSSFNHIVYGIDSSSKMIELAKVKNNSKASFFCDSIENLRRDDRFDLIVSIMVLQFIEEIDQTLLSLVGHLEKEGMLVIVIHNPDYIEECMNRKYKFESINGLINIKLGAINVPIYSWAENYYDNFLRNKLGLFHYMTSHPPFTLEYIKKYVSNNIEPTSIPKFLIKSYIKH